MRIKAGAAEVAVASARHTNKAVTTYPWFFVGALIAINVASSVFLFAEGRVKQSRAQYQRDSIYMEFDRYKAAYEGNGHTYSRWTAKDSARRDSILNAEKQ